MIRPSRLSLTLLVAGASALSALSLSAFTPDDPFYPRQWQWNPLRNGINISTAWSNGWTGKGVVIGIVDQYVDPEHPDLMGNYSEEFSRDFVGSASADEEVKYSDESHGVLVAGMAAAVGGNGVGITGSAPEAQIAGLHVDLSDAQIYRAFLLHSGIGDGNVYEHDTNIRIMNCSFGETTGFGWRLTPDAKAILDVTTRNNIIYVAAAGNDRNAEEQLVPPNANGSSLQSYEGTIVVGATSTSGKYAYFSNYGSNLFVTAPGQNVFSTGREGVTGEPEVNDEELSESGNAGYEYWSGTSASTPIVSGVIALAAQANVAMDARWAKHALVESCDILEPMKTYKKDEKTGLATTVVENWTVNSAGKWFSNDYGFGLVNADKFVVNAADIAYTTIRTSSEVQMTTSASGGAQWAKPTTETDTTRNPVKTFVAESVSLTQPLESVELTVDIAAGINFFQDLKITIIAPDGTRSDVMIGDPEATMSSWPDDAGNPGPFQWSFVSNAFWGTSAANASGDWKVEFTNDGTTVGTVNSASLKLNAGAAVLESESSKMVIQGAKSSNNYQAETLDVHALVLDNGTTFTIEGGASKTVKGGTLRVEDSVILNNGTLNVSGLLTAYTLNSADEWKGLKVYLNGGAVNLNSGGTIDAKRGVAVAGGVLTLNGGEIASGALEISGGRVIAAQDVSSLGKVVLSGGRLTTNASGTLKVNDFTMTGGLFEMGGTNNLDLEATGGDVVVSGTGATVQSAKIGASASTFATLTVPAGVTLGVGSDYDGGIGNSPITLQGYYEEKTVTTTEKNENGEDVTTSRVEIIENRVKAEVRGSLKSSTFSVARGDVTADGAEFSGSVSASEESVVSLGGKIRIRGVDGLEVVSDSSLVTMAGTIVEVSSVKVGGESNFLVAGGAGDGVVEIIASPGKKDYDDKRKKNFGFKCVDSSIFLVAGDVLRVNENVILEGNSVIELSFQNKLPKDTIEFIELTATGKSVFVEDKVSVKLDAEQSPSLWTGTQEVDLVYSINSTGTLEANLPTGVELVPLRLTYSQMTPEQKAIAHSLRTCLSEGENAGVSANLIAEINKISTLTDLVAAYHQFLPVNLVTINTLNNKQANAVTGAIERRARELRSGYPASDVWSVPLFNSYGFSFSANPNWVASSGMRQFAGYELNDNRMMLWANGGHSFSDGDAVGYTSKTETSLTNAAIGFDYAVNDDFIVGAFAAYSGGKTEMKSSGSDTESSMRSLGIYFSGTRDDKDGSFYYMGMASYGMGEYDFTRTTSIGSYASKASASPDGSQAIGYLALGYEWDAGSQALSYQWTTGPMVSLRYAYNSVDGYTESGNGADTLKVDDYSYDSLLASVGWRSTVRFDIQECVTLVPELRLSWQHEFLDGKDKIDAALALPGATPFSTEMNKEGSDYMTAGVGVTVLIAEATTVSLDYDVNFLREDSDPEHNINVMVRCRF